MDRNYRSPYTNTCITAIFREIRVAVTDLQKSVDALQAQILPPDTEANNTMSSDQFVDRSDLDE